MEDNAVATKISESAAQTKWRLVYPGTESKPGKTYLVTSYPDSDLLMIQTADTHRPVSKITGSKLYSSARVAIKTANAKELQGD